MISTPIRQNDSSIDTTALQSAHLVGVCGTGMKALAELLADLGCQVTGSDQQVSGSLQRTLASRGLRVHSGHNPRFLPANVDVVVHSPAVGRDNDELEFARHRRIPILTYNQMLGRLMETRMGVSIAGTHGKSTTTAMVASVLKSAGRDASAIIGAELCGTGVSGWAGSGELFVAESCEYQRNFLNLKPDHAVVLGIESDHFDCFSNIGDNVESFVEFASRIPASGSLLFNRDCPHSPRLAEATAANISTFSLRPGADWWACDLRQSKTQTRFRVFHHGNYFAEVILPLIGHHNVANALAAIGILYRLQLSPDEIRNGLAEFPGIRRRYERVGSWRGITLIDDFAHHPTAVRATLAAARQEFGDRRIWCAFQPHQVSRTQNLMQEFQTAFSDADRVLISPVFAAREQLEPQVPIDVSTELAERLNDHNCRARFVDSLDRMIATLDDEAQPGDVLVTMGAGDINRVHHEFNRRLQRYHSTR
jgi:UDP-N-acetylmuramate--alanine ligase